MPKLFVRRGAALLGSIGAVLAGVGVSVAHASFPGLNGKIVVTTEVEVACGDCADFGGRAWILGRTGRIRTIPARDIAYSPSGTRVAYEDDEYTGVWVARHDGSGRRLLARDATNPAWSPAGGMIAYRPWAGGLVVASADGRTKRRLPYREEFAWSPSGGQLAVANGGSLRIVGLRGRYARTLATADPADPGELSPYAGLAWSATGWLSYVRNGTLFILPRSGGVPVALHQAGEYPVYEWSPDGRRIAFLRSDGLWVMNVPDGTPRRVARVTPDEFRGPVWSPDGRLIAYVDWTGPRHRLFRVRANGGQPRLFRTFNDRAGGDGYAHDIDWQTRPRR